MQDFCLVVEAEHDFASAFLCAFNDVLQISDIENGSHFMLEAALVDYQNLVTRQHNDPVNFILAELIELYHWLEVHDSMIDGMNFWI